MAAKLALETKTVEEPKEAIVTELELTLSVQQQLLKEVAIYEGFKEEADENEELLKAQKGYIERLQKQAGGGAKCVSPAEGVLLTMVGGVSKKLDKKGLMKRFKITPAQWAEFEKETPKKPYLKITTPKSAAAEAQAKAAKRDARDEEDDRE